MLQTPEKVNQASFRPSSSKVGSQFKCPFYN